MSEFLRQAKEERKRTREKLEKCRIEKDCADQALEYWKRQEEAISVVVIRLEMEAAQSQEGV